MLSKKQRITQEMFKEAGRGKIVYSPLFSIRQSKISEPVSRFAVVVSGKVAKTAVKRNKIRRKLYSLIRNHQDKFPTSHTYVLFVKKEALTASFAELERSLLSLHF